LQSELGKKQAELSSSLKDYKNLENRLYEQQRKEEEIHRKATFSVSKYRGEESGAFLYQSLSVFIEYPQF